MRTHYTYWFEQGHIWRASVGGVFRAKTEILLCDRDLAEKLLDQHTESAAANDWFANRAAELRDEMSEAIQQYDQFHQLEKAA